MRKRVCVILPAMNGPCAAEMLCASQDSITDVALACGFGDAGYFDRMFRRFKGKTPGEFRRAYGT